MFVACQCNHQEVVEELLKHKADIHVQMVDGASPLFISSQNGHFKMLKYLLSQGAKANMKRKVSQNEPELTILTKRHTNCVSFGENSELWFILIIFFTSFTLFFLI